MDIVKPQVSIIMPAFNAAHTMEESIESVRSQTFESWELIVIDDGSTDATARIAETFATKDARIRLLKLSKNGGLPNARNNGCREAQAEFICFLDSDDLWNKDKLLKQIRFHIEHPDTRISHTDFELFDKAGVKKRPFKKMLESDADKQGNLFPKICYRNPIGILTVMVRKEVLAAVGYFDTSLWTMEDQDLWVKIARRKINFGFIPEVLAYYRVTPGSISSKTGKYKKAYKVFMMKLRNDETLDQRLIQRYYYRYFGTVYYKKNAFKLAVLYFWKSIKLVPYDLISLSTYAYLSLTFAKKMLRAIFRHQHLQLQ